MYNVRENFIKAIELLQYDIDEVAKTKETITILQDVTRKYIELFGIDDLSENDKICIQSILTVSTPQKMIQEGTIRTELNTQKDEIAMEKIIELLKQTNGDETFYESLYNLYVLLGIAKGINEINQGDGIPLEEFLEERESLYENHSRKLG